MDPEPADRNTLEFLASTRGAVVIDSGWRHNLTVDPGVRGFSEYRRSGALLEVRAICPVRENLVNASLGLLDPATTFDGSLAEPRCITWGARHLTMLGRLQDDTAISISIRATDGPPPRATCASSARTAVRSPPSWIRAQQHRPSVGCVQAGGHTFLPTTYESARRGGPKRIWKAVAPPATSGPGDLIPSIRYTQLLTDSNDRGADPLGGTNDGTQDHPVSKGTM
jgi:hypothetical protein